MILPYGVRLSECGSVENDKIFKIDKKAYKPYKKNKMSRNRKWNAILMTKNYKFRLWKTHKIL